MGKAEKTAELRTLVLENPGKIPVNMALPGNPRYQPKSLVDYFGYDKLYLGPIHVILATLRVLGRIAAIPAQDADLLDGALTAKLLTIRTGLVDQVERGLTNHDIRALVLIMQWMSPMQIGRWWHKPNTSYDDLESGRAVHFIQAHEKVVRKQTNKVIEHLVKLAYDNADVRCILRTHLQDALPGTMGFWFSCILGQLLESISAANASAGAIVAKISGATGNKNAQIHLGIEARCQAKLKMSFEEAVLQELGQSAGLSRPLRPALVSKQILLPGPLERYLSDIVACSAALAQLGDDGRILMSSRIGEFREPFDPGQAGSSTMLKVNPFRLENLVAMWRKNVGELVKVQINALSNLQRDLTGSAVTRDYPAIVVNLAEQLQTLLRAKDDKPPFIARLTVDKDSCMRNLLEAGDTILAEPLQIAIEMAGYPLDGYELVNQKARYMTTKGISLGEAVCRLLDATARRDGEEAAIALLESGKLKDMAMPLVKRPVTLVEATQKLLVEEDQSAVWEAIPAETREMFRHPENYIGDAPAQARKVAKRAEQYLAAEPASK